MFEQFKFYNIVLVTGPQRSGTTICARMIAHDTGLEYIDEQAFLATDEGRWRKVVIGANRAVIQCPGMARFVHEFGVNSDLAVVFMIRDLPDIIASQRRIGWTHENFELKRYPKIYRGMPIAAAKLLYWMSFQKRHIANPFEVDYASLEMHPLWVPKENRLRWHERQWTNAAA